MTIDNKLNAGKIRLAYLSIPFLFVLFLAVSLSLEWFDGFKYLFIVAGLFFLIIFFIRSFHFKYVKFFYEKGKLNFKFHGLGPLGKEFKIIELSVNKFYKFEIEYSFFDLKRNIILYQKLKGKIAKYPPISLSAMSRKDIDEMQIFLNKVLLVQRKLYKK